MDARLVCGKSAATLLDVVLYVLFALFGFVCGSIPFGLLVARVRGVDVRRVGSGNIGAANVARSVGKPLGALVLFCDSAKGALPVLLARSAAGPGVPGQVALGLLGVAAAAIVGHAFTPWLRFRGGKAVATSLGVYLVIDPAAVGAALLIFVVVFAKTRMISFGSLAAAAGLPIAVAALGRSRNDVVFAVLVAALVFALHRRNLERMRSGLESRFE